MMNINVYTISVFFSITFLFIVVEFVRKNRLQEKYSLIWILMSVVLFVLSISPVFIETFSRWLNIKNPPSFLFLFGLVYLVIYNLHTTVVISRQSEKITRLSQEIAILKLEQSEKQK